jgi:hypothetical protein
MKISSRRRFGVIRVGIVILSFLLMISVQVQSTALEVGVSQMTANDTEEGIVGGGRAWLDDIEYIHSADVYDSFDSAMKRISAQTIQRLAPVWNRQTAIPIKLKVHDLSQGHSASSIERLWSRSLQQASKALGFPSNELFQSVDDTSSTTEFAEVSIAIRLLSDAPKVELVETRLSYRGDEQNLSRLQIVEKPWVQSFGRFRNENPTKKFIQFRGNSILEAEQAVLEHVVGETLAESTKDPSIWDQFRAWQREHRDVRSMINESGIILDRFTQSFPLDAFGEESELSLSRCAVLVDLSSEAANRLRSQFAEWKNREWHEMWSRRRWLGAILLVVGLAYAFANSWTKGYYVWQLRGGAFVATILLIVALI